MKKEELRKYLYELIDEELDKKYIKDNNQPIKEYINLQGIKTKEIISELDDNNYILVDDLDNINELDKKDKDVLKMQNNLYYYKNTIKKIKTISTIGGLASGILQTGRLFIWI